MPEKLSNDVFNKALSLMYISGGNNGKRKELAEFDKFLFNYALFLTNDIELTDPEEKAVDDLYLEKNGSEIIVKGTIPKNYTVEDITFSIRDLLFSYLNVHHIRGKNLDDKLSWIYGCWDFNINTLGFRDIALSNRFDKYENVPMSRREIYKRTINPIDKYKSENPKNFSESEEQYYKILKNNNPFSKQLMNIIKKIQQIQNKIQNNYPQASSGFS